MHEEYFVPMVDNAFNLHYLKDICQLAWPKLETQLGQNSTWAKATTAFIFMCVCVYGLGKRTFP